MYCTSYYYALSLLPIIVQYKSIKTSLYKITILESKLSCYTELFHKIAERYTSNRKYKIKYTSEIMVEEVCSIPLYRFEMAKYNVLKIL